MLLISSLNFLLLLSLSLFLVCLVDADIYLHNPRGSNDRLNEKSAQRKNANRVFDSQNNNRGGYNVGDRSEVAAKKVEDQYQMIYFQSSSKASGSSLLDIEWTNQHGCGGNEDDNPNKMNCHLIFQYKCQPSESVGKMRDGTTTITQGYAAPPKNEDEDGFTTRKKNNVKADRAYQEPLEWYDKCQVRNRNKGLIAPQNVQGLFTADQNLKGISSKYTRQNPNGNRFGYECPEERDYYPYWHPTDWRDIGIYAENKTMCPYYRSNSFNVHSKWECVEKWKVGGSHKHYSKFNNEADCAANNGEWLEFHNYLEMAPSFKTKTNCEKQSVKGVTRYIWARPMYGYQKRCLVALDAPTCKEAPFSRDNHLGDGVDLKNLNLKWRLPHFPSGQEQNCIFRVRYNVTTDDYDPYNTNSSSNGKNSPVKQNPAVDIGVMNRPLRLAINTAQYGRVFQDRSHLFILKPRPTSTGDTVIHNLNVRGKRGNIVQTYPAVEYDFVPTNLEVMQNDLVHIQWTGSNSHNNGNPTGDGQAGDDGQGTTGTDRSNILGLGDRLLNYPLDMDHPKSLFSNVKAVKWSRDNPKGTTKLDGTDIAVRFASSGYFQCVEQSKCGGESLESKKALDKLLNNAYASFSGMLLQFKKGTWHYMSTRNNNFSNRSQKGTLIVK